MPRILSPKAKGAIFAKQMNRLPSPKMTPQLGGNAAIRPPKLSPTGVNSGFGAQKFGIPGFGKTTKPSGIGGIPSMSVANRRSTSRFGA